jgi:hypothetical protein
LEGARERDQMLGWLVEKTRRDKQFSADMMRAAMLEDRLHRLNQALATISAETLGGTFEFASSFAVLRVLGTADWERCFNTIRDAYNTMVQSKSKSIEAIGLACEAWFKSPDESRFAMLVEVFKMVREHVAVK